MQVDGIERAQRDRAFTSVIDLAYRSGASRSTLSRLAAADAMRSMGLDRRQALWQVLVLGNDPPLLEGHEPIEPPATLPKMSMVHTVATDYETIGLSLNAHPIGLIRKDLDRMQIQTSKELRNASKGQWMKVAGLVLVRQRPSTAKGIVFATLEDETGVANLIIRPEVYKKYRSIAHGAVALIAAGKVERHGEVVHLQPTHLENLTDALEDLRSVSRDFH